MKINVIDIETTGFSHHNDYIVEIGIVILDTDTGEIETAIDGIIHENDFGPEKKDAWVFSNSDLTYEDVLKAPATGFLFRHDAIQEILNTRPSTAFNSDFDFRFLENRNFKIPEKVACIMKAATPIVKLPGSRGYKWPKVEEAWQFFFPDTDYTEAHRAADDAIHEATILYEMIRLGHLTCSNGMIIHEL